MQFLVEYLHELHFLAAEEGGRHSDPSEFQLM